MSSLAEQHTSDNCKFYSLDRLFADLPVYVAGHIAFRFCGSVHRSLVTHILAGNDEFAIQRRHATAGVAEVDCLCSVQAPQ
jgi:hypothetical protein